MANKSQKGKNDKDIKETKKTAKTSQNKPKTSKNKGHDNLIPVTKRTKEEQRAIQVAGGIKSGQARKRKKVLRETFKALLSLPPTQRDKETVAKALGVEPEVIESQETILAVAMMSQARKGNVKAFEAVNRIVNGESLTDKEDIKIRRAELKMKQEKHAIEMEQYEAEHKKKDGTAYKGIPALCIAPYFSIFLWDVHDHNAHEFIHKGGRGSTKSSCIALAIIDLMMQDENYNALVMRQVSNTIKDSVYNQLKWAIDKLDLDSEFKCTKSPMEITRTATGQKIFFRGADDPLKIKSIKAEKGYIAIVWFEELDQFYGSETVRNIEQSAVRGGDKAWIFKSFNPPKTANNWANEYVLTPKAGMKVYHSTYQTVPSEWLGKNWLDEAKALKEINPKAYENEYLGEVNGTGGNVFENVTIREITDEEINNFNYTYNGLDWGWYPDPLNFTRCCYDSAHMTLYIYAEFRANKMPNEDVAQILKDQFKIGDEIVTCDSAENKSIADLRAFGISARGAEKGAGSVAYSMKWLSSLKEIVIDSKRCPNAAMEFTHYEFMRDKDGQVISGYPDKDNHSIDSVRYALNPVWKKKGQ